MLSLDPERKRLIPLFRFRIPLRVPRGCLAHRLCSASRAGPPCRAAPAGRGGARAVGAADPVAADGRRRASARHLPRRRAPPVRGPHERQRARRGACPWPPQHASGVLQAVNAFWALPARTRLGRGRARRALHSGFGAVVRSGAGNCEPPRRIYRILPNALGGRCTHRRPLHARTGHLAAVAVEVRATLRAPLPPRCPADWAGLEHACMSALQAAAQHLCGRRL